MTGEVKPQRLKQRNKCFFLLQTTECLDHPYYMQKCLDSKCSTFLLVNSYIIFNKFDKDIQLHMIVPYPRPDINNGPGVDSNSSCISSNPTRIMAPPQAIAKLGQMEDTPVQVSDLWSDGCHI